MPAVSWTFLMSTGKPIVTYKEGLLEYVMH